MDKNKENKGIVPAETDEKEPQHDLLEKGQSKAAQQQQHLNEKDAFARQLDDYRDLLQRLQAEFENYKKRVEKEKAQFRQFAAAEVVKSFLPVLDSFELALKSIVNSGDGGSGEKSATAAAGKIAKGLELIYGQFYSALESFGLRPINAVGGKLDPYRHEVLMQEETADEKRDGIVVEEFQKGYMLNGLVLRCSKVKVLKFAKINQDKNNVSGGK